MQSKTKPVLAKAIETTPEALILIMESGSVSIPWERCSERLARASSRTKSSGTFAFRLWHPLAFD